MLTIDSLKAYGADTQEGLGRCFGNAEFYLKLVASVPSEKNFGKLKDAMAAGDLGSAFEAAHALKGVLANLSLTSLAKTAGELTELLRNRTQTDYQPLLDELEKKRAGLEKLCSE